MNNLNKLLKRSILSVLLIFLSLTHQSFNLKLYSSHIRDSLYKLTDPSVFFTKREIINEVGEENKLEFKENGEKLFNYYKELSKENIKITNIHSIINTLQIITFLILITLIIVYLTNKKRIYLQKIFRQKRH